MDNIIEIKKQLRKELSFILSEKEKLSEETIRQRILNVFNYWQTEKKYYIDDKIKESIIREFCDEFLSYGPIKKLMEDLEITEIMIDGPYKVYIEKEGKKVMTDIKFDDEAQLRHMIEKMMLPTGRRVDESFPYVDFSLQDGTRVNVIIPPLVVNGTTVTIRKFLRSIGRIEDLVRLNTIDDRMAKFLVACIKAKINILFSGATGSGKTTTLEVLSSYINPEERIIVIEDTLELSLRQDHVVRLLTRPPNIDGKGEITIRDLFINTLRMRPTRIILGEIRGAEAMDYLQALNSGHRGCLAVIHSSSPADAISRLETMALYAGLYIPVWAIRKQIASGVNLIVQHEQLSDGSRKITYITEVEGIQNDEVKLRDIFTYEIEEVTKDGKVKGNFKAKNIPTFFDLFKKRGVDLSEDIFE